MDYINILIKSIFVDNMIFAFFLGMCSYLAVSKTVKTSAGLGLAVVFVLCITVPVNYLINKYLLRPGALSWLSPSLADVDLGFLSFIVFIAVIAAIVQIVEIIFSLHRFYMGTWVCGYGSYDPIPVPALPDGFQISLFTYPWVNFYSKPVLLLGFYPPGTWVMGTHCHP